MPTKKPRRSAHTSQIVSRIIDVALVVLIPFMVAAPLLAIDPSDWQAQHLKAIVAANVVETAKSAQAQRVVSTVIPPPVKPPDQRKSKTPVKSEVAENAISE